MTRLSGRPKGPLAELFDGTDDAVFIINEDGDVLFQNQAARHLLQSRPDLLKSSGKLEFYRAQHNTRLARLIHHCQHGTRTGIHACSLSLSPAAPKERWLLSVSSLNRSLAVLHPVFVVRFSRCRKLQRIPGYLLHDLFALTRREMTIVNAIGRHHSLTQIALRLKLSRQTIGASIQCIKSKCAVRSRAELLTLLHNLQYLSGQTCQRNP